MFNRQPKMLANEQMLRLLVVSLMHQDVQIAELSEREIPVDGNGQDRAFVWNGGDFMSAQTDAGA